jgi:hypothetical protein
MPAGILNRVDWARECGILGPSSVVAMTTPAVFVDSIAQMFGPLLTGGVLLAGQRCLAADPALVGSE